MVTRTRLSAAFSLWLMAALALAKTPYQAGQAGQGRLEFIAGVPVMVLQGSPLEMGTQQAALVGEVTRGAVTYPRQMLSRMRMNDRWPKLVELSRDLVPQMLPAHRAEMESFAQAAGLTFDEVLGANTLTDVYRGGFGCSSLIVEGVRSATGEPLFARNLDFPGGDLLADLSLLVVRRAPGKHAYASVGYPALMGCLSGMNDQGLAIAVHEVFIAADGSKIYNGKGMPYAFCFRQIMEECSTVEEAARLLRATPRTTMLNLAVCDKHGGCVLEMTPKSVEVRRPEQGLCACTNHFRTEALRMLPICNRYSTLARNDAKAVLGIPQLTKKLIDVNAGDMTLQSMIFEPGPLVLHLSVSGRPATSQPLHRIELAPLLSDSQWQASAGPKVNR